MIFTTLNRIRACSPCESGWRKLLANLGKTKADDEPLALSVIFESNGLNDALWCLRAVEGHRKSMRLFAVECARSVQHLKTDPRSIAAIDVAERYANGLATDDELQDAWAAAEADAGAAWAAAEAAAWAAVWSAQDASCAAADTVKDTVRDTQSNLFLLMCEGAFE